MSADPVENPAIELVEEQGETTLLIGGGQAMQAWEADLMRESADILCGFGSDFLEVGLGLGISALRIAQHPNTRRHVVVEKYREVIDIFRHRHSSPPATLEIVHADFFEHVRELAPGSLDGIFFDPYLADVSKWRDQAFWDGVVPWILRALRLGGAFLPCFTTQPVLRWQFAHYFDRVIVERRSFAAYPATDYTCGLSGDAFIQCFVKTR